jgi:AcrR family transcriptional regulator
VRESQRWRLLGACAEIIADRGYAELTVRALTKEAAVSKGAFYRLFEDLEDCVVATYRVAAEYALFTAREVCTDDSEGGGTLRARVALIFDLLLREPALTQVLAHGAVLEIPGARSVRDDMTSQLTTLLTSSTSADRRANPELRRRLAHHSITGLMGYLAGLDGPGSPSVFSAAVPQLAQLLALPALDRN